LPGKGWHQSSVGCRPSLRQPNYCCHLLRDRSDPPRSKEKRPAPCGAGQCSADGSTLSAGERPTDIARCRLGCCHLTRIGGTNSAACSKRIAGVLRHGRPSPERERKRPAPPGAGPAESHTPSKSTGARDCSKEKRPAP